MTIIKNKEKCADMVSKLIQRYSTQDDNGAKDVAKTIDEFIFDYLRYLSTSDECFEQADANMVYTMRELRNLFFELQTV